MKTRARELAELKSAVDRYADLAAAVKRLTQRNPQGLRIKPLLNRRPSSARPSEPAPFRQTPWRDAA